MNEELVPGDRVRLLEMHTVTGETLVAAGTCGTVINRWASLSGATAYSMKWESHSTTHWNLISSMDQWEKIEVEPMTYEEALEWVDEHSYILANYAEQLWNIQRQEDLVSTYTDWFGIPTAIRTALRANARRNLALSLVYIMDVES